MTSKDLSSHTPTQSEFLMGSNPLNPFDGLRESAEHELQYLVRLELVAEDMVDQERALYSAYLAEDAGRARHFWQELKDEVLMLEHGVGEWLLTAADPSRVEWQRQHLLDTEENSHLH